MNLAAPTLPSMSNDSPVAEDYHKSWFFYVKTTILILKVVVVSFCSIKALMIRKKLKIDKVTPNLVQFLLISNVLILMGVLVFDLTQKVIWAFFLLIFLANYVNLVALH